MGLRRRHPLLRLVRSEVRGDEPGPAGRCQISGIRVNPVVLDEIPVGHDDTRGAGVGHRLSSEQGVTSAHPALECSSGGVLDDGPVHHGVGIGHPDLDEIDADTSRTGRESLHGVDRIGYRRVPHRQETNQGRTILLTGLQVGTRTSGHSIPPVVASTLPSMSNQVRAVSTSLSPRPDTVTMTIGGSPPWSGRSLTIRSTPATA